jgi:hypothetical protein
MSKNRHRDSFVWGIILIVLGVIFLLESFDVEIWHYVWRLWPLILIAWGADKLWKGLSERKAKPAPEPPAGDKSDAL